MDLLESLIESKLTSTPSVVFMALTYQGKDVSDRYRTVAQDGHWVFNVPEGRSYQFDGAAAYRSADAQTPYRSVSGSPVHKTHDCSIRISWPIHVESSNELQV